MRSYIPICLQVEDSLYRNSVCWPRIGNAPRDSPHVVGPLGVHPSGTGTNIPWPAVDGSNLYVCTGVLMRKTKVDQLTSLPSHVCEGENTKGDGLFGSINVLSTSVQNFGPSLQDPPVPSQGQSAPSRGHPAPVPSQVQPRPSQGKPAPSQGKQRPSAP